MKKLAAATGVVVLAVAGFFLQQPALYGLSGLVVVYFFSSSCGG